MSPRMRRVRDFIADQARQTSTRTGLLFLFATAAGYAITDQQLDRIMAGAGIVSAVFAVIWPDAPRKK